MGKKKLLKDKILDSWIMVEQLSEGDFKDDGKKRKISIDEGKEYYSTFIDEITKKLVKYSNTKKIEKIGIIVYFNIFKFKDTIKKIIDLKDDYEVFLGEKFSFSLSFDKELKLLEESIFFTASYYIESKNKIPTKDEFDNFENDNKKEIKKLFNFSQGNKDEETQEKNSYSDFFNEAFKQLIEKYSVENIQIEVVENLEATNGNLHSFFIRDLEKAKIIDTENLNRYIFEKTEGRKNLDTKKDSENFNPKVFENILQPKNYPLSRFPSNPEYALSFMQQVAVNLAIKENGETIKSVNGPPGTGKTTLLKDIFADFVVKQAYEIINKENKFNEISYQNITIDILPECLANKEIIVASSNNGAVQNIVNELPQLNGIDDFFKERLLKVDYFTDISNSKLSYKLKRDENQKFIEILEAEKDSTKKNWGLFSLEGGKAENVRYIITSLRHVYNYFETYNADNTAYGDFEENYKKVIAYRDSMQKLKECYEEREKYDKNLSNEKDKIISLESENKVLEKELDKIEKEINEYNRKIENNEIEKNQIKEVLELLKIEKPNILERIFNRSKVKAYDTKKEEYRNQLLNLLDNSSKLTSKKMKYEDEKVEIIKKIEVLKEKIETKNKNLEEKLKKIMGDIEKLEEFLEEFLKEIAEKRLAEFIKENTTFEKLDMSREYAELHLSNPWFNKIYRILQAELFIDALRVRKQFLYEKKKNIKAACEIWSRQDVYLDKNIILQAWNWINFVIPVISSTFASFSGMCKNLEANSLGYLFVDEAGQALPQAAVGAIFRSKNVMVVGDPAQIRPVITLPPLVLAVIRNKFGVDEKYLSDFSSVQTLVDATSKYGFYKSEDEWIGIPLWVHRRCLNPMFDISNTISYNRNMVQGNQGKVGEAYWYDVKGRASDKYVKEQGEFLVEKIEELKKNGVEEKDIFVISPFKNVVLELKKVLKDKKLEIEIGTVHIFQGKEAKVVFFVLGCDKNSKGAANWAVGSDNPNIMNVAATRAKERFYIIGDKELYTKLESDVIKKTYEVLEKHNKK